jgi:hypothetical protein
MRFEMDAYFKVPLLRGGAVACVMGGMCSQSGRRTNTALHPSQEGNRTGHVKNPHTSYLKSYISQKDLISHISYLISPQC